MKYDTNFNVLNSISGNREPKMYVNIPNPERTQYRHKLQASVVASKVAHYFK